MLGLSWNAICERLLKAVRSQRVLVAVSALIVAVLIMFVPSLEVLQDEVLTLIVALILATLGGYTVGDAARIARERPAVDPNRDDLRGLIRLVLIELLDEFFDEEDKERLRDV